MPARRACNWHPELRQLIPMAVVVALVLVWGAWFLSSTVPGSILEFVAQDDHRADVPLAAAYSDAVLADKPLAFWRLDDSGTRAVDATGRDAAASLIGDVQRG